MGLLDDIFGGASSTVSSGGSFWSNPDVLSAGILAGTSLLSNLFGGSAEEDLANQNFSEQQRQFDMTMALKEREMLNALEIAKMRSGGDGGAGAMRDAQLRIAKANAIGQAQDRKSEALQLPLQGLQAQSNAAQVTGVQSGNFFNNLLQNLQNPAMRAVR